MTHPLPYVAEVEDNDIEMDDPELLELLKGTKDEMTRKRENGTENAAITTDPRQLVHTTLNHPQTTPTP